MLSNAEQFCQIALGVNATLATGMLDIPRPIIGVDYAGSMYRVYCTPCNTDSKWSFNERGLISGSFDTEGEKQLLRLQRIAEADHRSLGDIEEIIHQEFDVEVSVLCMSKKLQVRQVFGEINARSEHERDGWFVYPHQYDLFGGDPEEVGKILADGCEEAGPVSANSPTKGMYLIRPYEVTLIKEEGGVRVHLGDR